MLWQTVKYCRAPHQLLSQDAQIREREKKLLHGMLCAGKGPSCCNSPEWVMNCDKTMFCHLSPPIHALCRNTRFWRGSVFIPLTMIDNIPWQAMEREWIVIFHQSCTWFGMRACRTHFVTLVITSATVVNCAWSGNVTRECQIHVSKLWLADGPRCDVTSVVKSAQLWRAVQPSRG